MDQWIKDASSLNRLLENKTFTLTSLLIANMVIILFADNLTYNIINNYFDWEFETALITTLITSILILFFGEVFFRTVRSYSLEKFSLFTARPVEIVTFIFYPFSLLLIKTCNLIDRLLGIKDEFQEPSITEEHIIQMVEEGEEQGVIEEQEKNMIHSIISFRDTIAREVMIPRISMVCKEVNEPIQEFLKAIFETGYSRIPVYEDNIDNITGIVYAKDMLKLINEKNANVNIKEIIKPAYFIPEIKKIGELLKEMQQKRISMAVVVDEYGGIDGLVTIEDIIEEIVGEIEDEYDQKNPVIEKIDDITFIVDARMNIEDVNSDIGSDLPVDDCETIGGFVYGLLGRIPLQGEEVKVDSLSIVVEKIQRRVIKKLKIKILADENKEEEVNKS